MIFLYGIISLVYLLFGRINADEAWYLEASRFVYENQIPYRDFAFTQTPLLPYLYGIPQALFGSSLYLGRITSVLISISNFILCINLSRKYAGDKSGILAALLFLAFPYGLYFNTIVKTYALVALCFTVTLTILSSRLANPLKYPLAILVSTGAALTRLSALPFTLTILVYCLVKSSRQTRLIILALCAGFITATGFFVIPFAHSLAWNLVIYHLGKWRGMPLTSRLEQIFLKRIPGLVYYFPAYFILAISLITLGARAARTRLQLKAYLQPDQPLSVYSIGVLMFAAAHLVTGGWTIEYLVPAINALLPIFSIGAIQVYDHLLSTQARERRDINLEQQAVGPDRRKSLAMVLWSVSIIAGLTLDPIRNSTRYIDLTGGQLPIEEVRQVANFISMNTHSSDTVFVLEALWIPFEAHRRVLPGMTMAQFSYQPVSTAEAGELHVVNGQIAWEYLAKKAARVVILTDLDWQVLARLPENEGIQKALTAGYTQVLVQQNFGQRAGTVQVYFRKDNLIAQPVRNLNIQ